MNLLKNMALAVSGGLVVGSIILSMIGLSKSVLSRKSASVLSGVGAGVGCGIFIYYGVSNADLLDSIIVGIIVAVIGGFSIFISSKWWR
jgi:hypothetical protein